MKKLLVLLNFVILFTSCSKDPDYSYLDVMFGTYNTHYVQTGDIESSGEQPFQIVDDSGNNRVAFTTGYYPKEAFKVVNNCIVLEDYRETLGNVVIITNIVFPLDRSQPFVVESNSSGNWQVYDIIYTEIK